jgi:type I restriction enzyme, R subunit
MATGTGKTYTAFPDHLALWKAKAKKRILFLADRNILVDQTMQQDFAPFGEVMHKVTNREVKKNYEIYLACIRPSPARKSGSKSTSSSRRFLRPGRDRRVPPRQRRRRFRLARSARLLHFRHPHRPDRHAQRNQGRQQRALLRRAGLHLLAQARHRRRLPRALQSDSHRHRCRCRGLHAGERQGRQTGPSGRAAAVQHQGLRPQPGAGKAHPLVASKVWEYLKATDPMAKTIVFCDDQDHAERMRQELVKLIPAAASNRRYVMRITGDDNEGKAQLSYFIDNDEPYPSSPPPPSCSPPASMPRPASSSCWTRTSTR